MKTRQGFVSNSSTSSFVLVGFFVKDLTEEKINEFLNSFATKEEIEEAIEFNKKYYKEKGTLINLMSEILSMKELNLMDDFEDNITLSVGEYFLGKSVRTDDHDITSMNEPLALINKANAILGNNPLKLITTINY